MQEVYHKRVALDVRTSLSKVQGSSVTTVKQADFDLIEGPIWNQNMSEQRAEVVRSVRLLIYYGTCYILHCQCYILQLPFIHLTLFLDSLLILSRGVIQCCTELDYYVH